MCKEEWKFEIEVRLCSVIWTEWKLGFSQLFIQSFCVWHTCKLLFCICHLCIIKSHVASVSNSVNHWFLCPQTNWPTHILTERAIVLSLAARAHTWDNNTISYYSAAAILSLTLSLNPMVLTQPSYVTSSKNSHCWHLCSPHSSAHKVYSNC